MNESTRLAMVGRGIWARDPSAWTDHAGHRESIPKWLGWLDIARSMREKVAELTSFAGDVRQAGFTHALLLGMGGSSLAPEVMRLTSGLRTSYLDLAVLDSTDPVMVKDFEKNLPAGKTIYIVSSKSGGTVETACFQRYYYEFVRQSGAGRPGQHFVAVTDAGTAMERLANQLEFRRVFLNPADIGGRYSALSYFGLVPAALLGIDLTTFLDRAVAAMDECSADTPLAQNSGAQLGAFLASHAAAGRDKVTLVCSEQFRSFGYWAEQLLAESTGKEGKGLLPVEGEPLGAPEVYGQDRVFVTVGDPGQQAAALGALEAAGHPIYRLPASTADDLAYQFFIWEFATAVAGALMDINAFDQPNVQESKDNTGRVLQEYEATGKLPSVPEHTTIDGAAQEIAALIRATAPGDYLALQAYTPRAPEIDGALAAWRLALRDRTSLATTAGFGPRFLHSTGQLHKGGPNTGVFIQIVSSDRQDVPIPEAPYTFATLKQAQAIGDLQSLLTHGRRVVRAIVEIPETGDAGGEVARAIGAIAQATQARL